MGTFDAATIFESLDYDFTALAGHPNNIAELADAKGTVPEPTSLQVQQYMQASAREMQRLQREAAKAVADAEASAGSEQEGDGAENPLAALTAGIADADMKQASAQRRREAAMLSKLCSGNPSTEILLKLPHRHRVGFAEWLLKEVMDPEAVTGAGEPRLKMVRSPAAG